MAFPLAFAQHHGGQQAPPITFGSGQVTVSTTLVPSDYTSGRDSSVDLNIRFFDTASNVNIDSVSYRVQIFYGPKLVANQMFFDKDGELNIKIQPKSDCQQEELWKCTKYYGESDPIVPNALVSSPSTKPVIVGPVFDQNGEYTVKTSIIGAKNPKTATSEDIDFETTLIIPSENQFTIVSNSNEYAVNVKNYQYTLSDFDFDPSSNSLMFTIPFDPNHIEHMSQLRHSFEFQKDFSPFENVKEFSVTINDHPVSPQEIHFDTISKKNVNTLHFTIDNSVLKNIPFDSDKLRVAITPKQNSSLVEKNLKFDNGYSVVLSYDSVFASNNNLVIKMGFFDQNGDLVSNVRYGYSLKEPNGKEVYNTGSNPNLLGIELKEGTDTLSLGPSENGTYHMQIVLIGVGIIDFNRFQYVDFDFQISQYGNAIPESVKEKVPGWIKNNAKWWAEGSIDDSSFVQGIQFLIKDGIMAIPQTNTDGLLDDTAIESDPRQKIPDWIKNNAKWWSDGLIGEDDFIKGIEFLIKSGIVVVY